MSEVHVSQWWRGFVFEGRVDTGRQISSDKYHLKWVTGVGRRMYHNLLVRGGRISKNKKPRNWGSAAGATLNPLQ